MAMIEFINALTGTRMFVDPSREAEYLAAGHTRAADKPAAAQPAAPPAAKAPRPAPKKRPAARK